MSPEGAAARRGVLVAFEGIDGAGKTTQVGLLAERLRADGRTVVVTKEPTAGVHGRRLRESATTGRLAPAAELATFEADRREHVATTIGPALARGEVVIVDRYYLSTVAYQGARGMDPDEILIRNEGFAVVPDVIVLLDLPIAIALERIRARGDGDGNLFERADMLEKCAAIFAAVDRPYVLRLDGRETPARIHERIVAHLEAGPLRRLARGEA